MDWNSFGQGVGAGVVGLLVVGGIVFWVGWVVNSIWTLQTWLEVRGKNLPMRYEIIGLVRETVEEELKKGKV
jgi:hypothetical protein